MEHQFQKAQSLKLLIVLSRAYHAVEEKLHAEIRSYGLNPTEFAVLELLYHKGRQPLQQIGDKVLLSSGSITYVVDKLEKRGLLERKSCPSDRRITYAVITESGESLLASLFPSHESTITSLFGNLTPDEMEQMIHLLKKSGHYVIGLKI